MAEVIINIEVESQQAQKNIQDARKALEEYKLQQKELDKAYKDGAVSREQYIRQLAQLKGDMKSANDTIKANEKAIKDNAKAAKEAEGSLNQMRSQLASMKKAYAELSAEQRNNASVGGALLQSIQQQDKAVKDLEASMGDHQRNVGNYPKVFDLANTSMGKFAQLADKLSQGTGNVGVAMKGAGQAVAAFGKQLLALLANPIVAIIAAIAVVVLKLVDAFKKSDDAMTSLKTAFAAFQPILTAVNLVFEKLAEILGKVALGIANVVTAVLRVIPAFKDAQDAAQGYEQQLDKLQDAEREYTVEGAKNTRDIAELRAKATEKDKYSAEERLKFLNQARTLEEKNLKAEKDIAAERLRLARQKAKQDRDTSDETKDRLAELEAAMYKAEENFYQGIRRLDRQAAAARNEQLKEEEEAQRKRTENAKKYAEKRKQQQDLELQYYRMYEEARIAAIKDTQQREEEALKNSYNTKIEDLKKTLETEKNLTPKARQEINDIIIQYEQQLQTDLTAMREKYAQQSAQDSLAAFKKAYSAVNDEYVLTLKQQLQEAGLNAEAAARAQVEYAEKVRNQLKGISYLEGEDRKQALDAMGMSETQYAIAMVDAEDAVTAALARHGEALKAVADAAYQEQQAEIEGAKKSRKAYIDSAASITGSLSDMLNEIAGDNEEMQGFLTAVAMANVAASTAQSIANAIQGATAAAAQTGIAAPFTTPAFIAEMVGIVLGTIAQATALLKKATAGPSAPKFAEGGLVEGPGTGTSDSIHARLSNGESVMTAKATMATAPLLSAINQMYGGAPIGGGNSIGSTDAMREMMVDVMAEVRPVVSVKEITRVQNRVTAKETIAKN